MGFKNRAMIQYREATPSDYIKIAQLHAESWQINYRGMWADEYLDGPVLEDRLSVWEKRFGQPESKRFILLAEEGESLVGFACSFLDDDPKFGALLDNLHVAADFKRRGIGRDLLMASAKWVNRRRPESAFYLWVLEANLPAIRFYEKLGGIIYETVQMPTPYGAFFPTIRFVWPDTSRLL